MRLGDRDEIVGREASLPAPEPFGVGDHAVGGVSVGGQVQVDAQDPGRLRDRAVRCAGRDLVPATSLHDDGLGVDLESAAAGEHERELVLVVKVRRQRDLVPAYRADLDDLAIRSAPVVPSTLRGRAGHNGGRFTSRRAGVSR